MTIEFRDAVDADGVEIITMISAIWADYGKTSPETEMPQLFAPASAYRPGGRFWVAVDDGVIVGTVAIRPHPSRGSCELQKLYVLPTHRRKGLATRLVKLVEDECVRTGHSLLELWSDVKLEQAHEFYKRSGYIENGKRRFESGTVRFYFYKEFDRNILGLFRTIFLRHPASVGETYWQHMRMAGSFTASMALAALACAVHAVVPILFTTTGSQIIKTLYARIMKRNQ